MKSVRAFLISLLILALFLSGCTVSKTDPPGEDRCAETFRPVDEKAEDSFPDPAPEKPVIYLYPQDTCPIEVLLDFDGELTCTYPVYRDGWHIIANPDGTLIDQNGLAYNYLYWEGVSFRSYDLSRGFCVAGEDSAAFLEEVLPSLGLNRKEANEFIVYWLPRLQAHAYNLISFQQEAYTDGARLTITPEPDTLIRVFMAFMPLNTPLEIEPQALEAPERIGFTVVEWGGCEVISLP